MTRTFASALVLGIMGGLGLAYLAEISDKSFRTPEEIRRRLGLPVVGQIPLIKLGENASSSSEDSLLAPVLCAYHHPRSPSAEAYRGVRTALYFSAGSEGHKVIQVTSPSQGDGKSTLAANLAVTIARAGNRILLMDADLRRPRVHVLFGLSPTTGLASVISGETELSEATQESGIEGLQILACGPIPPNPAELLTSPRFEELLSVLRDQYDFVLIDTPPLLAVTDPSVVASRADGVLLTFRITKDGRYRAERAREVLDAVGARTLGVVVNATEKTGGRYGYGGYGYGYGSYHYQEPYVSDDVELPPDRSRVHATSRNGAANSHAPLDL